MLSNQYDGTDTFFLIFSVVYV